MKWKWLFLALVAIGSFAADSQEPAITCKISGVEKTFPCDVKATDNPRDGFHVFALGSQPTSGEFIGIEVPVLKKGRYTLENTPGLRLSYSRSWYSSNYRDHLQARSEFAGSKVEVTITKRGDVGERVEGTFSATATTGLGTDSLMITNGVFSVIREEPKSKK